MTDVAAVTDYRPQTQRENEIFRFPVADSVWTYLNLSL